MAGGGRSLYGMDMHITPATEAGAPRRRRIVSPAFGMTRSRDSAAIPMRFPSHWSTRNLATAAALLLAALAGVAALAYLATRPGMSVLPPGGSAEWIVFPSPANVQAQFMGPRTTVFDWSFSLPVDATPEHVTARVRALGHAELFVNDRPAALSAPEGDGRRVRRADIAQALLPGLNRLRVNVTNAQGPPALWLAIAGDGWSLASDGWWTCTTAGSSSRYARPATAPVPVGAGSQVGGAERTWTALKRTWPTLLAFAAVAGTALAAAGRLSEGRRGRTGAGFSDWLGPALVGIGVLWLALYANNRASLRHPTGFDVGKHFDYIRYIQQRKALPLADEGWEMHQPPLFYVLSAAVLGVFDVTIGSPASVDLIRALNFFAATAFILFATGCLRLLLPGRPAAQGAGLAVAAFLPMNLYMAHYLSNDILAAALGAGAVYACLRVVTADRPETRWLVLTGVLAGAAVLTKVTAVPVIVVVFAALAATLGARRERRLSFWGRILGVPLIAAALVSGWHFVRVWQHFGTPFVGSFDPQSGFRWWQDPGFVTVPYLLRFGRSLVEPFFSEFNGFPDGLYSTLWGDGLWGGVATRHGRAPWNYDLMTVGYLLALVPTAFIVCGFGAALVRLARSPSPAWAVLVALCAATALAVLYHFLRLPYACHVKAFYALPAAAALAAFAGLGFDVLTLRFAVLRAAAALALCVWAVTAYASYWVAASAPATETWIGHQFLGQHRPRDAEQHYTAALRADPGYSPAEVALGNLLASTGHRDEAQEHFQRVIERDPDDTGAHLGAAMVLFEEGQLDAAAEHYRRVLELRPDSVLARPRLGVVLMKENRLAEAIREFRDSLALTPSDAQTHYFLAMALAARGAVPEALEHARLATQWNPEFALALDWQARILATYPDAAYRDGKEAVRLAQEACALTRARDAALLDTLAAALAETGAYDQAVRIQETAIRVAESAPASGTRLSLPAARERLSLYQSRKPYREKPKI